MNNNKTIETNNPDMRRITRRIFTKKINNNSKSIPLKHTINTIGETRHFVPSTKEWYNSVYAYNSNYIKNLSIADKNLSRIIKSYFNMYLSGKLLKTPQVGFLKTRFKRLSMKKIFISKAELKHTTTKVIVTLYVYNEEKRILQSLYTDLWTKYLYSNPNLKEKGIRFNKKNIANKSSLPLISLRTTYNNIKKLQGSMNLIEALEYLKSYFVHQSIIGYDPIFNSLLRTKGYKMKIDYLNKIILYLEKNTNYSPEEKKVFRYNIWQSIEGDKNNPKFKLALKFISLLNNTNEDILITNANILTKIPDNVKEIENYYYLAALSLVLENEKKANNLILYKLVSDFNKTINKKNLRLNINNDKFANEKKLYNFISLFKQISLEEKKSSGFTSSSIDKEIKGLGAGSHPKIIKIKSDEILKNFSEYILLLEDNKDKFNPTYLNKLNTLILNISKMLEETMEFKNLSYYKLLLKVNSAKFEDGFLLKLRPLISKIYNKEVEFNIINLKHLALNSDIFTEIIGTKMKDPRKNGLLRVLRLAIQKVKISTEIFNKKVYLKDLWVNKAKNLRINVLLGKYKVNQDTLNQVLLDYFPDKNSFISRFAEKVSNTGLAEKNDKDSINDKAKAFVINSLKYKKLGGVRLEARGRLTKRFTAARSVFKLKWKGGLKNIDSSNRGLSTILLRGHFKPNVQYTYFNSKTRIGAFGLKGWISGK
jgi:DNA-binding XRE family transcriptional regulator